MTRKFTQAQFLTWMRHLKETNPQGYKELDVLYQKYKDELSEKERKEEERLERIAEAREKRKRMLIPTGLPNLNTNVFGMVAFRVWRLSPYGKLKSTFKSYEWDMVNISDKVPTEENSSGLYCVKLTALTLLSGMQNYFRLGKNEVCGLVELRGTIQEHSDGILRAEWARILYFFITSDNQDVEGIYLGLYNNYPGVPIHILNPEQLAFLLIGETLKQQMRGD